LHDFFRHTLLKENQMHNRHGITLAIVAALVAALGLTACEQRNRADSVSSPPAASKAPSTSQSMAATSEKVAAAVDDTALTAKVKAALLAEPGLKSLQINVETKNAEVVLSGFVDSDASRERAKQVASNISGVATVVDQLTVKSS
jgi:hyperosmotically inducible periplasmic protein